MMANITMHDNIYAEPFNCIIHSHIKQYDYVRTILIPLPGAFTPLNKEYHLVFIPREK